MHQRERKNTGLLPESRREPARNAAPGERSAYGGTVGGGPRQRGIAHRNSLSRKRDQRRGKRCVLRGCARDVVSAPERRDAVRFLRPYFSLAATTAIGGHREQRGDP